MGYSDWLRDGRTGDRIPVAARFSASVQTGPGAHPASCTMGTGYFQGVKSGRGVTLTPSTTSSVVDHERVELHLYSPYGPYGLYRASVPVQGCTLPLPFMQCSLTLRLLMSYIYIYIYIYMERIFLKFLDHTQRRTTVGMTPLDE